MYSPPPKKYRCAHVLHLDKGANREAAGLCVAHTKKSPTLPNYSLGLPSSVPWES